MRVYSLLNIIKKLAKVLELYQGCDIEEMLDDIYKQVSGQGANKVMEEPDSTAVSSAGEDKLPPEEAVVLLIDMDIARKEELLNRYIVKEIRAIAQLAGIKIPSKVTRKADIIKCIATYDITGSLMEAAEKNKPAVTDKSEAIVNKNVVETDRLDEAAQAIQEMNQEQIMEYLKMFKKWEILEIARRINFRVSSNYTKDNIIILLAKNLGFKDLNRRISQRPRQL